MGQICGKPKLGDITRNYSYSQNSDFVIQKRDLINIIEIKGNVLGYIEEHHGGLNGLENKLKTSFIDGLNINEEDLKTRKTVFGTNIIPPKPPKTFFGLILESLKDYIIQILLVCVAINIGVSIYTSVSGYGESHGEWNEGIAILVAVLIVVLTTAGNDFHKERQFRSLQKKIECDQTVNVIRNQTNMEILCSALVVGDICVLKYGDVIPADGIVIQSSDLYVDESHLTGESDLVKKTTDDNVVAIGGTHVVEGSAKMVVLAVGVNSQAGIIFNMLGVAENNVTVGEPDTPKDVESDKNEEEVTNSEESHSVLQTKLNRMAIQIGYVGTICAILTVLVLIVRLCYSEFVYKQLPFLASKHVSKIIDCFITGITVIVVAVPEGLPLAVTLSLAYSIKRMLKDNNMVRHLSACETMGNATVICSDKTGTLTTNRMTAVELFLCDVHHKVIPQGSSLSAEMCNLLCRAIAINSSYSSQILPVDNQLPKQMGNKTECGLLGLIIALGQDYNAIRQQFPEQSFVKVFPFNSARKSMSTVVKVDNNLTVFTKGAAENIVNMSLWTFDRDGQKIELSAQRKEELNETVINVMANNGLRTIGVAYKIFTENPTTNDNSVNPTPMITEETVLHDMILIAIIGIMDPVRDEVPNAIKICQTAGISVRMVTGDNVNTARSIAKRCGILQDETSNTDLVLESKEFNQLIRSPITNDVVQDEFDKIWPKLKVLARSSPQDKYTLVSGIIRSTINPERDVVAVTGDGTNDGPALKVADVGFAMGQAGTDVAKEASDIILIDDNFSSIVKAVMWGRNVYDSISKFLQFQMTVNVVSLISTLVSVCITAKPPFRAVQMLWVNLIMDTLASLALATEQPTEELLNRKPYGRHQSLLSLVMIRNIVMHSFYQLIVIHILIFAGPMIFDFEDSFLSSSEEYESPSTHSCLVFSTFVVMTLFNEINARKVDDNRNVFQNIFTNILFPIIWIGSLGLQIIISEFGGTFLFTHKLSIDLWGWCFFFGIGELLWQQFIVCFSRDLLQRLATKLNAAEINDICCQPKPKQHSESVSIYDNQDAQNISLARMRWIRGIKRIQTQIHVVKVFENSIKRAPITHTGSSESPASKIYRSLNN